MVLEFLADGFEEIEALTPTDILRRAGVEILTVAVTKDTDKVVTGAHGISVIADISEKEAAELQKESIDMIILPGGMPGSKNLDESEFVDGFVKWAAESGKYIAAICAAPMILGRRGLLFGRAATCYPGFEDYLAGATLSDARVVVSDNYITSPGMGAALDFALELTKLLKGDAVSENIRTSVLAK